MKKLYLTLILFTLVMTGLSLKANNVKIDSVSLIDATTLRFKISWDNSWRTAVPPTNYDAVWLFVKRAFCPAPVEWLQANVSSTLSHHYAENPLEVYLDNKNYAGLFVQRRPDAVGSGDLEDLEVRIRLVSPAIPGEYDYRVFAVEMVYIPQGSFYLGDGCNSPLNTTYGFFHEGGNANYDPYLVTAENQAITISNTTGNLYARALVPPGNIPAAYPKGYNAFYCMKYEITQDQMAAFFNHNSQQIHSRWWSPGPGSRIENGEYGQIVTNSTWGSVAFQFYWRPFVSHWSYGAADLYTPPMHYAFLDWSGLRPMTEFEYEKICRGPSYPVEKEYAWGTNVIKMCFLPTEAYLPTWGTDQETHNVTLTNPTMGIGVYCRQGFTLLRVGGTVKTNTNRISSGSSYWGVTDMTGNLAELVIGTSTPESIAYTNNPGDGILSNDGYCNQATWPAYTSQSNTHWMARGLLYTTESGYLPYLYVSSRVIWNQTATTVHFRGVR